MHVAIRQHALINGNTLRAFRDVTNSRRGSKLSNMTLRLAKIGLKTGTVPTVSESRPEILRSPYRFLGLRITLARKYDSPECLRSAESLSGLFQAPREKGLLMFKQPKPEPARPMTPSPAPAPMATAPVAERHVPATKNYVSSATVIEGNITSSEDLHLDGHVKGDIKTTARLVLGKDAFIEGNILAAEAEVAGRITGTVESKGLLAIKSTCVIEGDIITKSLNVESGSSFNGRCKVGGGNNPPASEGVNRLKAVSVAPVAAPVAIKN